MSDSEHKEQPPKILPPHYFVGSTALILATLLLPGRGLLASPWVYAALLPMLLGVALAVQGSRQFAAAGTNIVPLTRSTALVTNGAFALSRNPMYLGMLLFLGGLALIADNPWAWLVVAAFWAVIEFAFIRREEVLMATTFGDAYLAYRQRVRRWL